MTTNMLPVFEGDESLESFYVYFGIHEPKTPKYHEITVIDVKFQYLLTFLHLPRCVRNEKNSDLMQNSNQLLLAATLFML